MSTETGQLEMRENIFGKLFHENIFQMKQLNLLLVITLLGIIILSCKKHEPLPRKKYKCSCDYSANTLDNSGTYTVNDDTFTVSATSIEEPRNQCESFEELYVWNIIDVGCTASQ